MLSRLRLALQSKDGGKLGGEVEVDETYIGGKARNMHKAKRARLGITQGRSMAGKVAVMGLLDRHGKDGVSQSPPAVVDRRASAALSSRTSSTSTSQAGATIHTDSLPVVSAD